VSSVCEELAISVPKSGDIELTAITNSLRNATVLGANSSIRVIICPGNYDDRENAAFGPQTVEFLGRYSVDAVIMSAGGISGESVTDANSEAAAVKRAMLKRAKRSILVMDRRKLDFQQFETVCDLADIDDLVTDESLGPDAATIAAKTRVHVAAPANVRVG
jgi:DeoR/GlpR family transcriptional regulator of sugar metabolism